MTRKGKIVGDAEKVFARLKQYENLSFLERYAVLMSQIQWVELILKRLLTDVRGYDFEELENYTAFGRRFLEILEKEGMQESLLVLLRELKDYRNYFAHEFLADQVILSSILKEKVSEYSKPNRLLSRAIFSFEQFLLMHEELPQPAFFNDIEEFTNPKGGRRFKGK